MAAGVSATALSSQGIDTSQFGSNPTAKFYRKILPGLSTIYVRAQDTLLLDILALIAGNIGIPRHRSRRLGGSSQQSSGSRMAKASPAGFEPATSGLGIRCSIQLSYGDSGLMVDVSIGFSSCTSSMEAAQPSVLSGAGREQPPIADQYSGLLEQIGLQLDIRWFSDKWHMIIA